MNSSLYENERRYVSCFLMTGKYASEFPIDKMILTQKRENACIHNKSINKAYFIKIVWIKSNNE